METKQMTGAEKAAWIAERLAEKGDLADALTKQEHEIERRETAVGKTEQAVADELGLPDYATVVKKLEAVKPLKKRLTIARSNVRRAEEKWDGIKVDLALAEKDIEQVTAGVSIPEGPEDELAEAEPAAPPALTGKAPWRGQGEEE